MRRQLRRIARRRYHANSHAPSRRLEGELERRPTHHDQREVLVAFLLRFKSLVSSARSVRCIVGSAGRTVRARKEANGLLPAANFDIRIFDRSQHSKGCSASRSSSESFSPTPFSATVFSPALALRNSEIQFGTRLAPPLRLSTASHRDRTLARSTIFTRCSERRIKSADFPS